MTRRYLRAMLLTVGLVVTLVVAINVIVDPMRYYHAPLFEIGFSENQRFQNPGLARSMDYDIALIGTSHTEHFPTSRITEALGQEAINLSISGSLIAEQSLMVGTVLKAEKAKRVIWEINYPSFSLGDMLPNPGSFPRFLFEPGAETPFRYFVSWDVFLESLSALRGVRPNDLDELHRWDRQAVFGEEQVLAHWDFMSQRWTNRLRDYLDRYAIREDDIPGMLERFVGARVASAPEVEFELLLLPATLLEFGNDLQIADRRLDRRMRLRNEVARLAEKHANVTIRDFQNVPWLSDPSHYKDIDHFNQEVVAGVLEGLANDRQATPAEVRSTTVELRHRVVGFMDDFCSNGPERCQQFLLDALDRYRARIRTD